MNSCRVAVVVFAMAVLATVRGQLASRSPFVPPQGSGAVAPTAGAALEFRGTMETPEGGKMVRIYDPARKAGAWLKPGERDSTLDVLVKQFDEAHDTVTIEHEGKPLTLAERVAKVASGGMPQGPMPVAAPTAPPMPSAVTNSVVLNPTPQQEQARLEAVAAEVARRRALREQAAQQVTQPQPQPQQRVNPLPAMQQAQRRP